MNEENKQQNEEQNELQRKLTYRSRWYLFIAHFFFRKFPFNKLISNQFWLHETDRVVSTNPNFSELKIRLETEIARQELSTRLARKTTINMLFASIIFCLIMFTLSKSTALILYKYHAYEAKKAEIAQQIKAKKLLLQQHQIAEMRKKMMQKKQHEQAVKYSETLQKQYLEKYQKFYKQFSNDILALKLAREKALILLQKDIKVSDKFALAVLSDQELNFSKLLTLRDAQILMNDLYARQNTENKIKNFIYKNQNVSESALKTALRKFQNEKNKNATILLEIEALQRLLIQKKENK